MILNLEIKSVEEYDFRTEYSSSKMKKFKKMEWKLYWTITQEKAPKPG